MIFLKPFEYVSRKKYNHFVTIAIMLIKIFVLLIMNVKIINKT